MRQADIFLTVLGQRTDSVRNHVQNPRKYRPWGLLSVIHVISLFIVHYSYIGNTVSSL
jgi:hypothetical protein